MINCALVIGHKESSQGAINEDSNITEFKFNNELAFEIEKKVKKVYIQRIFRKTYKTLPDYINEISPKFIISLHCNAFNTKSTGTEVLYYHRSKIGKEIAEILNNNLVNTLNLKDRGIKKITSEDRGGYLLKYTNAPCIISEPFFIDNDNDLKIATENYQELIKAYVKSIEEIGLKFT